MMLVTPLAGPGGSCTRRKLLLLALLCYLLSPAQGYLVGTRRTIKRSSPTPNMARFNKPYKVCTSTWDPMVRCDDLEPQQYTGYQIALWRQVAADLGWLEDKDWSFSCMRWSDMMDDIVNPEGNCTLAAAAVEMSPMNILAGIKFTWPIYQDGLQVLVSSHIAEWRSFWDLFNGFHWMIWMMIPITSFTLSFIFTWIELSTYSTSPTEYGSSVKLKGYNNWRWYIHCLMLQQQHFVGDPRSWASRLLAFGWGGQMLILVYLFTASTTLRVTSKHLESNIQGPGDLAGKDVVTWEAYVPVLRRYSIGATAVHWNDMQDQKKIIKDLHDGTYDAAVLDSIAVKALAASAGPACDLFFVGDVIEMFQLGMAFPPTAPDSLVAQVSGSVLRLQASFGFLDTLEKEYIESHAWLFDNHTCEEAFSLAEEMHHSPQITMRQVAALWFILAGLLLVSLAITWYQRRSYLKKVHANPEKAPDTLRPASFDMGAVTGTLHGGNDRDSMPGYLKSYPGDTGQPAQLELPEAASFSLDASAYLNIINKTGNKHSTEGSTRKQPALEHNPGSNRSSLEVNVRSPKHAPESHVRFLQSPSKGEARSPRTNATISTVIEEPSGDGSAAGTDAADVQ